MLLQLPVLCLWLDRDIQRCRQSRKVSSHAGRSVVVQFVSWPFGGAADVADVSDVRLRLARVCNGGSVDGVSPSRAFTKVLRARRGQVKSIYGSMFLVGGNALTKFTFTSHAS
jgi:hypothetical protein